MDNEVKIDPLCLYDVLVGYGSDILLLKIYIYGLLLFFLMVNTVPIVAGRMFEFFQIVEVVLFPLLIYCFPQKKIGYMCMLAFAITIFFFKTFKLLQ